MTYSDFIDDVKSCIEWKVEDIYEVKINHIKKNNAVELDGVIFFKEGDTISPNIYLNHYYQLYQEGKSVEAIAEEIISQYEQALLCEEQSQYEFSFDFENMKDRIIFRVVNYQKNKQLMQEIPHVRFLDLAITFHCLINRSEEGIGTIRLTNEHMKQWNATEKELMHFAIKNTPRLFPIKISPMEDIIEEILRQDFATFLGNEPGDELTPDMADMVEDMFLQMHQDGPGPKMFVMSNTAGINGASSLIYKDAIHTFAMEQECDFYILPSSIHEVILIPYDPFLSQRELKRMVQEVNGTQVADEEVLSDRVYTYCRNENRIQL